MANHIMRMPLFVSLEKELASGAWSRSQNRRSIPSD